MQTLTYKKTLQKNLTNLSKKWAFRQKFTYKNHKGSCN